MKSLDQIISILNSHFHENYYECTKLTQCDALQYNENVVYAYTSVNILVTRNAPVELILGNNLYIFT